MPNATAADTYNAARGFTDWTTVAPNMRQQAIVRASDYIEAAYPRLRDDLDASQQDAVDRATYIIARDLATNRTALPVRAAQSIVKQDLELKGMKKVTEYGEQPADPYPGVTALLVSAGCLAPTPAVIVGRLVRG